MPKIRFNPVTLLLLVATVSSTLMSFADILPKGWLPYIVIAGALATAAAKQLVSGSGQGGVSPVVALVGLSLLGLVLSTAACDPKNVGAVARGIYAGADEAERELVDMHRAGEIDEETLKQYGAIIHEAGSAAQTLNLSTINWKVISTAQKRALLENFIGQLARSADKLDQQGVLGIKSARARRRVEDFKRNFRRGLSILRVIKAALPVEEASPASKN